MILPFDVSLKGRIEEFVLLAPKGWVSSSLGKIHGRKQEQEDTSTINDNLGLWFATVGEAASPLDVNT